MERLTCKRHNSDGHTISCSSACRGGDCGDCVEFGKIIDRLAAYEDTGLTPGEVRSMQMDMAIINAMFQYADVERMQDLARADRDGRVVVLPCKDWFDIVFGEQTVFYGIDTGYIEEPIREISVDNADRIGWYDGWKTVYLKGTDENGQEWQFLPDNIGKIVFLTHEEAEEALRRDENG